MSRKTPLLVVRFALFLLFIFCPLPLAVISDGLFERMKKKFMGRADCGRKGSYSRQCYPD